jgi:acyl dehydratase
MTEPIRYAEDYAPGQVFDVGTHTFTAAEIIAFSREWDPHPFHIDEAAAKQTMFGGLIASGWHTALVMMRMLHQGGFLSLETSIGSPGHEELKWLRPVRPGEVLRGQVVVNHVKISTSRPELGFVNCTATLTNPAGEVVYLLTSAALIKTRAAG